jgi:hypothetical protein
VNVNAAMLSAIRYRVIKTVNREVAYERTRATTSKGGEKTKYAKLVVRAAGLRIYNVGIGRVQHD